MFRVTPAPSAERLLVYSGCESTFYASQNETVSALMFNSPTITVSKHRNSVMPHLMLSKTHINLPFDEFSLLSRKPPKCGCFRLVVRPGLGGNGGERICQRTKMKEAESIMLYNINCKRINVTKKIFYT